MEESALSQVNTAQTSLTQRLLQDDRKLENFVPLSVVDPDDGHEMKERAAKLISRLSEFDQQGIESRLSRIYLQQLEATPIAEGRTAAATGEQQIEHDLKSLYVEISDVAKMSATQVFHAPLVRAIDAEQNRKNNQTQENLDNVKAPK